METTAEAWTWSMVAGIILGVGSAFLVVWLAWKLTPYMYNFLFFSKKKPVSKTKDKQKKG